MFDLPSGGKKKGRGGGNKETAFDDGQDVQVVLYKSTRKKADEIHEVLR
jgi:hypothetical protein